MEKDQHDKEQKQHKVNMFSPFFILKVISAIITISFWHFLGAEGLTPVSTRSFLCLLFVLITLILIYRIRVSRGQNCYILFFLILFLIAGVGAWFRSSFFYLIPSAFTFFFNGANPNDGQERSLSLPGPSSGPSGPDNGEDPFDIDVLLESWPATTSSGSAETGTSVNQPESGRVPPANAPRGDEAGPSNQPPQGVVPYPYSPEEVIGGDSVLSIERRLLAAETAPSPLEIYLARINAEDLFEVKVEIIKLMTGLDPTGDWLGRGARALDNPRTATGEESLERLHSFLDDLNQGGKRSETFLQLKGKVFLRDNPPENSST